MIIPGGSLLRTNHCSRPGVIEEAGKRWCRQHAPGAVAIRRAKRDARWDQERALSDARDRQRRAIEDVLAAIRSSRDVPYDLRAALLAADTEVERLRAVVVAG